MVRFLKRILGLQDPFNPLGKVSDEQELDPTVLDWLNETFPSRSQLLQYVRGLFPFCQWLGHYNLQWFFSDLIAGVTVSAVVIPESVGYAKLAGLPAHYGLYASFTGGMIYWIFATSKDITIGPVAVLSTVIGAIVRDVQIAYPGSPAPQIAMSIAIICGGVVTFLGLTRLGFIIDFIPLPSITAFMTGSAILICSGQVKNLLGETASFSLDDPAYQIILNVFKNLPSARGYDAAMGLSALVLLYGIRTMCNYGAQRYPRRAKLFFFFSNLRKLFVILFFTMISAIVNIHRQEDPVFEIVGYVPRGLEDAGVPILSSDMIQHILPKLPAAVVVMVLEHVATSKSYSRINNYTVNISQELIAIGITNLLGPFVGGYPSTGSLSRSTIQSKAGVRTPLAGVISSTVVLIAIYGLTPMLSYIPHASLSAVIIHVVADLIAAPNTIYQFWLISPLDAVVFAAGLIVLIINRIENSIYVTVCLSLAILLFRHIKASGRLLGRTWIGDEETQRPLFFPISDVQKPRQWNVEKPRPGVFIYRFSEGLSYSNVGHYLDALAQDILKSTRRTCALDSGKKGDRPWNDPKPKNTGNTADELPLLRAIVFDFSAVNNVDVTCVQGLIDVRNQLNRHAAPSEVQWHFANIKNRWTKRALSAAGFGYPTMPSVVEGQPVSVEIEIQETREDLEKAKGATSCKGQVYEKHEARSARLERISRRFFHADLIGALESVDAYL
ncbi:sulfate anion transporter [Penicillium odoratum]|uniref:sulfate anion transporter n=1 Tax=Penicillium odoratum TaxID=1167516 RepID=UPI0025478931|nr:sulfate anion transporter [Penicillium odoratum]KAJ5765885.1 sulfate anion transporter [Penicillium odoratum]